MVAGSNRTWLCTIRRSIGWAGVSVGLVVPYTGLHAFLAIVLDLFLGSVFWLVSIVIELALRTVVIALQVTVIVLKATWSLLVVVMTGVGLLPDTSLRADSITRLIGDDRA